MSKKQADRIIKLTIQEQDIQDEKEAILKDIGLQDWDNACSESMKVLMGGK